MRPEEIELDILSDLAELEDEVSQYSYLIECGKGLSPMPNKFRTRENEIPECQVKTWVCVKADAGTLKFYADSESLIVKGMLAFLEEIYGDKSLKELEGYRCRLLDHSLVRSLHSAPCGSRWSGV